MEPLRRLPLHNSCQQALVHGHRSSVCPWYLAAAISSRGGVAVDAHITDGISVLEHASTTLDRPIILLDVLNLIIITLPKRQSLTTASRLTLGDRPPTQSAASSSDDVERDDLSCRLESTTSGLLRLDNLIGGPSTCRRRNRTVP